jgi:hypothetical protein
LEVSVLLFLRPGLVNTGYKTARSYAPTRTLDQSTAIAVKPDWQGYFGDPSLATSDHGHRYMEAVSRRLNEAAIKILDGEDPRKIGRMNEPTGNSVDPVSAGALREEEVISRRQQEWLRRSGLE